MKTYEITYTTKFNKDIKRCIKRGLNMGLLKKAILILERDGSLPKKYRSHKLSGNYQGVWECHIKLDWLLIWKQDDELYTLQFERTGTHSDLF